MQKHAHQHRYGSLCMPCPAAWRDESEQGCSLLEGRLNHASLHSPAQVCMAAASLQHTQLAMPRQLHSLRAGLKVKLAWECVPAAALLHARMAATSCSWQSHVCPDLAPDNLRHHVVMHDMARG